MTTKEERTIVLDEGTYFILKSMTEYSKDTVEQLANKMLKDMIKLVAKQVIKK